MAGLAELEQAFLRADAAGDIEAATVLAAAVREARAAQGASASVPVPSPGQGAQPSGQSSGGAKALQFISTLAGESRKSAVDVVDFLGPGAVNSLLRVAGIDFQVPTLSETGGSRTRGAVEAAATMASSLPATAAGGIAGVVQSLNPMAAPGAGAQAVEDVSSALTFGPRTQAGTDALQGVATLAKPYTDVVGRVDTALGDAGYELAGPVGGAVGKTATTLFETLLGSKLLRSAPTVATKVADTLDTVGDVAQTGTSMVTVPLRQGVAIVTDATKDRARQMVPGETQRRASATGALLRQEGDVQAAGYRLNDAGRVVPDAVQQDVMKQGLQPKLVAMVNSATKLGKQKMRQMLDNVTAQQTNMLDDNMRPGNVAGESILTRAKIVQRANRAAGEKMKPVVDSLKGQSVDVNPAVMKMQETLDEMGVKFDPKKGTVNFTGSIIDDLPGPENAVKRLLTRMLSVNKVDAYEAHKLKRYIDEVVTYGKGGEGLSGEADRMLKRLRHDINATLGESFPAYKKVNTQYHETIEALDGLQDIAGKRMDLSGPNADRALGVLSRRVFSNAVSGVPLDDAINQLDQVARKYVSPGGTDLVPYKAIQKSVGIAPESLDDSLQAQIRFASELERHFKIAPSNSFQGGLEKAADIAQSGLMGGSKKVAVDTAVNMMDRMRGINEDNAMKALRRLLAD